LPIGRAVGSGWRIRPPNGSRNTIISSTMPVMITYLFAM